MNQEQTVAVVNRLSTIEEKLVQTQSKLMNNNVFFKKIVSFHEIDQTVQFRNRVKSGEIISQTSTVDESIYQIISAINIVSNSDISLLDSETESSG